MTTRPDKGAALKALRRFQRRTVDHVVRRLLDESGSQRFLVADEVGLGKTLVARGVIAEFIDHHWDSRRIDIIYMCSNSALARENLRKLRTVGDDHSTATTATRLTLLARRNRGETRHDKLNFISLTPETAIRTRGTGIREERQVLFHLMCEMQDTLGGGRWLSNFLRGYVENQRWQQSLNTGFEVDESLAARFRETLLRRKDLLDELEFMREAFARVDSRAAQESLSRAGQLIGRLRNLLAQVCISALEPDLVILDEFQRFKNLLVTGDETTPEAELAHQIFSHRTPQQSKVSLLLLSATPYRMFTTNEETATEDHHADFLETARFLLDDETKYQHLRNTLGEYRRELLRATRRLEHRIGAARESLEHQLLAIMSRRERVASTDERDAMVTEPKMLAPLDASDVRHYLALAELRRHMQCHDLTELWKSAPFLLNFAKDYEFKRCVDASRRDPGFRGAFEKTAAVHLTEEQLRTYQALDPANGRLRALASEVLDDDRWRMLWLPPSLPYWPLEGPWKGNESFTKKLLFSAWNVVPDTVSAWLSYELERRMAASAAMARDVPYEDFYRKSTEPLRFAVHSGSPSGMTTLSLQVPSLRLAAIHPLTLEDTDIRGAMRERVIELLSHLHAHVGDGPVDRSWYWAAPLLLDDPDEMRSLLEYLSYGDDYDPTQTSLDDDQRSGNEGEPDEGTIRERRSGSTGISVHVARALEVLAGQRRLGTFPDDLADVLVDHALGNPAILWARTLAGFGVPGNLRRQLGADLADAVRSLFNQPPVVAMLHAGEESAYWRTTLHYAIQGNLQSVLDEYAHQLWEPENWAGNPADEVAVRMTETAVAAITTKTSRIRPDYFRTKPRSVDIVKDGVAVRTHFALRYGNLRASGEASEVREDVVRDAFKSPFYPFVLASTSVGQEGLDFHPWCHAVWHWNLPGNPVDLEQREGRVHRYKGHAVRKNVAERNGKALRTAWGYGDDPWRVLFELAETDARRTGAPELVPCWIAPGSAKVQRCVPMLPFSKELEKLENLKRSLAIYRVVFGQPRQEELIKLLHTGDLSIEELESWMVRLEVGTGP